QGRVLAAALSPDGSLLATGGGIMNRYGSVKLWDVATGKELANLAGVRNWVECVLFTPDGKTLLAGGGTPQTVVEVTAWDVESERQRTTLEGHTAAVICASWSRDGKL